MQSFRSLLAALVLAFCLIAQVYVRQHSPSKPPNTFHLTHTAGSKLLRLINNHEYNVSFKQRLQHTLRLRSNRHRGRARRPTRRLLRLW